MGDSRPCHLQGNGAYTGLVRQAWGVPSLALCNLANFDHLYSTKYIIVLLELENNSMEYLLVLNMNLLGLHVFHIFLKYI